ncbi:lysophospholipid acyltransferase family protein [Sphingobacterium bovistauri]|uniref:Lysophospholipid acyltransferase family protein n=1 Tax=Sphingobacterium bovistauri TaxID=2781959 RepID=A0ABS7Z3L4_9SPHI|nr:lysophospholipid acyltransferase family protein [Sphingobacterium bovistauri]MCA5003564.1 lysophospholipid acyltransferase family protein [Sphingobacterium bovistauri]
MSKSILKFLFWSVSLLPHGILYLLSDALYILIYYVFGYRKKVVLKNLRKSFPEKSEQEIKSIAKIFYKKFPDLIVEAIKMASISEEEVKKRVELINPEEINRHLDAGRGIICVTSHYSNWEMGIHRLSFMTEYPKLVIYKPLNNKNFNEVFNNIRTRFGAQMVPMKQILRHIVKLKNQPYFSVFVADQTPVYQDSDYYLTFLNQETLVYTGAERIAKLTNNPIVFCEIIPKEKRGYYYSKFTTLVEDPSKHEPYEITHIHNKYTEDLIRKNPPYWLWTHNRWKRQRRTN